MTEPISGDLIVLSARARAIDTWMVENLDPEAQLDLVEWLVSRGTTVSEGLRRLQQMGCEQANFRALSEWRNSNLKMGEIARQVNQVASGGEGVDADLVMRDMLAKSYALYAKAQESFMKYAEEYDGKGPLMTPRGMSDLARETRQMAEALTHQDAAENLSSYVLDGALRFYEGLMAQAQRTGNSTTVQWLEQMGIPLLAQIRGELEQATKY